MNLTFKKLGLSASIAMLTLGLSSCNITASDDGTATTGGSTSEQGNSGGSNNGGGSSNGGGTTIDDDAVSVISDSTYNGSIPLNQKVEGTPGANLQTAGNPFSDAYFYVSPDIKTMMDYSLDIVEGNGDSQLANKIKYIQRQPSAIWMDSIETISGNPAAGRRSLEEHLDAALAQQAYYAEQDGNKAPMTIVIIVYNLPDRDCAAYASNGKLIQVGKSGNANGNGFQQYKQDYIQPIADIFNKEKYKDLRLVAILEPDSFPNMVTNTDHSTLNPQAASLDNGHYCDQILNDTSHGMNVANEGAGTTNPGLGLYGAGIRLAIKEFADKSNVYTYLDIGHSGWLGWDGDDTSNMKRGVKYFKQLIDGADGAIDGQGLDMVRGFATNTSGYTPTEEPLISNNYNDREALSDFYKWNISVDEMTYIDHLRNYFTTSGSFIGESKFDSNKLGFIIDTARNGWGTPNRPAPGTGNKGTDLNQRVDKRVHRGHWCNINQAGIGEVPKANPDASRSHLDAFFWMKPPGESDGVSFDVSTITDAMYNNMDAVDKDVIDSAKDPVYAGKSLDTMCIDNSQRNGMRTNVVKAYAPHAGAWFHKQFIMMVDNAYPALGESDYD